MDEHPRPRPAAPGAQDALADRVYRSSLSEGERALRGPWRNWWSGLALLLWVAWVPGPYPWTPFYWFEAY